MAPLSVPTLTTLPSTSSKADVSKSSKAEIGDDRLSQESITQRLETYTSVSTPAAVSSIQANFQLLTIQSDLHKSMATVKVGFSEEVFVIHKELLCHYSTYFKGALEGSFIEAEQGVVYLREANVKTFTLFEAWLYRQQVRTFDDTEVRSAKLWDELVDLYVFADAHGVGQLGNQLVDAVMDLLAVENHSMPALPTVARAWKNLLPTSPMRKLFVNLYAWEVDGKNLVQEELQKLPCEFLTAVLLIFMKRLPRKLNGEASPFEKPRCKFHVHRSQDEAKECRETQESLTGVGKKMNKK